MSLEKRADSWIVRHAHAVATVTPLIAGVLLFALFNVHFVVGVVATAAVLCGLIGGVASQYDDS